MGERRREEESKGGVDGFVLEDGGNGTGSGARRDDVAVVAAI